MPDPYLSGQPPEPDVDSATWREVHLQVDRPDGGCTEAWLLRPPEWLAATGASAGRTIPVDMPEMGTRGAARVVDVTPCPPIEKAAGSNESIVTGRFVTTNALVMSLWIAGLAQPIGCTPTHPFWSEDRAGWVAAGELVPGEVLRTLSGDQLVIAILPGSRTETVYNLEIHQNHTFFASRAELWVHNACRTGSTSRVAAALGTTDKKVRDAIHKIKDAMRAGSKGRRNPDIEIDLETWKVFIEGTEEYIDDLLDYLD